MGIFDWWRGETDLTKLIPEDCDYEGKMQSASALLGVHPDDVVSIKIRPIARIGTLDQEYVTPSLYQDILRDLRDAHIQDLQYGLDGHVFRISFSDGNSILYVEA